MSRRRHDPLRGLPLARLAIAAQVALALVVVWFLASSLGVRSPLEGADATLRLRLPDAAGLDEADRPQVTVGGVRAGQVAAVRLDRRRGDAVAEVRIARDLRDKLFADATVRLLPRSALGDLVVDVDPGDPSAGPLRGDVVTRSAPTPVGYDQALGALDADVQAYAQVVVGTLREMLADRPGALRRAVDELPTAEDGASRISALLARRRRTLTRIVGQLDRIAGATGSRSARLTRAIRAAERTLAVTARRQDELRRGLTGLPATLGAARRAARDAEALATPLVPATAALRPVARRLPAGLAAVRAAVPSLRAALASLQRLDRGGRAPLRALGGLLAEVGPVAAALRPVVPTVEKTVRIVIDQQADVRKMMDYWPGTLSSQNGLGVTTRTILFRVAPIDPRALGLPAATAPASRRRAGRRDLARAVDRLRDEAPRLVQRPSGTPSTGLAVTALRALLSDHCRRERDVGCTLLGELLQRPPREVRP